MADSPHEIEELKRDAASGDMRAVLALAFRYVHADGVERNRQLADEMFRNLAKEIGKEQSDILARFSELKYQAFYLEAMAIRFDCNKDYETGLSYLKACANAKDFSTISTYSRDEIPLAIYFRERGSNQYFEAQACHQYLSVLADRDMKVFIPSDENGYSPDAQALIMDSLAEWNSALNAHFRITRVANKAEANISFNPVSVEIFSGTAIARCYRPQSDSTENRTWRLLNSLTNKGPITFANVLGSGRQELLCKRHKSIIQIPTYPCSTLEDALNFKGTCLHEIGHALGMGHSIFGDDAMYGAVNYINALSERDVYAIQRLYKEFVESDILAVLKSESEKGNPYGLSQLGRYRVYNSQYHAGTALLKEAVKLGNAPAQVLLGLCYFTGRGVDKDEKKAVEYLEQAVAQGDIRAHYLLGQCCLLGWGLKKDISRAMKLFDFGSRHGDSASAQMLAIVLTTEEKGDNKKVDELFEQAEAAEAYGTDILRGVVNAVQFLHALKNKEKRDS